MKHCWVVLLSLAIAVLLPAAAQATIFVVDSTGDQADATAGSGACATVAPVRCTLRAAIQTVNATAAGAPHTIAFAIPTTDAGFTPATGVFAITPAALLPSLNRIGTIVNGTTQATSPAGNTNPLTLGTGGSVGVDNLPLPQLAAPEIVIRDNGNLTIGLDVAANNVEIRGLAIHGFGNSTATGDIRVGNATNLTGVRIIGNLLGAAPAPAPVPTLPTTVAQRTGGNGIVVNGPDIGTLIGNIVSFAAFSGIAIRGTATGWTVTGNELRNNAVTSNVANGLTLEAAGSINNTLRGNMFLANGGAGFDSPATTAGPNTIENNTFRGNGVSALAGVETSGLRIQGVGNLVDRNVVTADYGAGILVVAAAGANRLTRNSIFANGTISNTGPGTPTNQVGIDLLTAANSQTQGTAPFVTLNDAGDTDAGGNGLANFPILTSASRSGGDLVVTGFARPGAIIELFVATPDASGFGEGQTYLTSVVEGSGADTDSTAGTYGPGAINALVQGTDTTNAFRVTVPVAALPASPGAGSQLTATSTVLGATSEFSGNVTVTGVPSIADLSLTLTDVPDPAAVGQAVTYLARVTNTGPDGATGATTTITLPAGTTVSDVVPSQGTCGVTGLTVTCTLGAIASTNSATITIVSIPTQPGLRTATATVLATEADPAPANNAATTTTTVAGAAGTSDISVAVHSSRLTPTVQGRPAAITMIITNTGSGPVTGVRGVLRITGAQIIAVTQTSGTCAISRSGQTRTLTCALGDLAEDEVATVAVAVRSTRNDRIETIGTATMDQRDATPADATNIAASTSAPQGRLSVTISAPQQLRAGQVAPYAITVRNRTSITARNVVVTISLPRRDSVLTRITTAHTARSLSFYVGDLAAGQSRSISLTALVDPAARGLRRIDAAAIAVGGVSGAHTTARIRVAAVGNVPVTG